MVFFDGWLFILVAGAFAAAFFATIKQQLLWALNDFYQSPGWVILILFLVGVLLFVEPG